MNKYNPAAAPVQHSRVFMNPHASVEKACTLIKEAENHPADLIVFPETWLPGHPARLDVAPITGFCDYPSDGHHARSDVFNLQVNASPQQNVSFTHKNSSEG